MILTAFHLYFTRRELTVMDLNKLMGELSKYANASIGDWLNDIDYRGLKYYWCMAMKDTDVLGARLPFGNSIYIQPSPNEIYGTDTFWLEMIVPIVLHELRHVWQKRKLGVVQYLIKNLAAYFPKGYEKSELEKDAFAIEEQAEDFFNKARSLSGSQW